MRKASVGTSIDSNYGCGGFPTFPQIHLLKIEATARSPGHLGVSDGLEAVQRAEELKPDLILLDIGLATLNGIEAARRIRGLLPESKIIFLTLEASADVI